MEVAASVRTFKHASRPPSRRSFTRSLFVEMSFLLVSGSMYAEVEFHTISLLVARFSGMSIISAPFSKVLPLVPITYRDLYTRSRHPCIEGNVPSEHHLFTTVVQGLSQHRTSLLGHFWLYISTSLFRSILPAIYRVTDRYRVPRPNILACITPSSRGVASCMVAAIGDFN